MLALLLGLVLADHPYSSSEEEEVILLCDKSPSCLLQVNGTLPLASIIATLPNGGAGYPFTPTDCIRGLIGLTEPCQCENHTMWSNGENGPGFCYFSGNYSQHAATGKTQFCKNQNGLNTFSMWNTSIHGGWPWSCQCMDATTGEESAANFVTPVCEEGRPKRVPCSTDGKNDNAAILAKYTGKEMAALVSMGVPRSDHFGSCRCGEYDVCSAKEDRQYCSPDIGYCLDAPTCDEDKVFEPTDKFQEQCVCGWNYCVVGDKCQTKVIDGIKKYACTLNGGSSNPVLMIKTFHAAMGLVTIFSIIAFVFVIVVIVFWILTCLKVNKAAKPASTNVQGA